MGGGSGVLAEQQSRPRGILRGQRVRFWPLLLPQPHTLSWGEPQLGPPPAWDRSQGTRAPLPPAPSSLLSLFLSLTRQLLSASPRPAPPHQLQLGPWGPPLTHQAGKDNPGPAGATGVSSGFIAGASRKERGQLEVTESAPVRAGEKMREGQGPGGVWSPVQRWGKGSLSATRWPRWV